MANLEEITIKSGALEVIAHRPTIRLRSKHALVMHDSKNDPCENPPLMAVMVKVWKLNGEVVTFDVINNLGVEHAKDFTKIGNELALLLYPQVDKEKK